MSNKDNIVALIADIFERRGADAYLGEAVTTSQHMTQAAALAQADGADDALVAAALLHDIGHFTSEFGTYADSDTIDRHHDAAGAHLLEGAFPPLVVDAVRLHVAAKRYLCAVEPGYHAALSPASQHSLMLQGGPMRADEIAVLCNEPYYKAAVRVRRWDDRAKVAGLSSPDFASFRPILERLLRH